MGTPPLPNLYGRQLSLRLKHLREKADLGQHDVASEAYCTLQKISRIEAGQVPGYHELKALLAIYGVPQSEWAPYLELWDQARKRPWWRQYRVRDDHYLPWEDVAAAKYEFQLGRLPTLLQTEQYARAAIARTAPLAAPAVDNAISVLMRQQERLFADQSLRFHALIHLPALRRGVNRAQMLYLILLAELPSVTLQVVPQSDDIYAGLCSSLVLLSFDEFEEPDIAFCETLLGLAYTQDPTRTSHVRQTLDRLAALAMTPEATLDLIKAMAGQVPRGQVRAGAR